MDKECFNCTYWARKNWMKVDNYKLGQCACKRHSPILKLHCCGEPETVWPKTYGEDYCGDWEKRNETPDLLERER